MTFLEFWISKYGDPPQPSEYISQMAFERAKEAWDAATAAALIEAQQRESSPGEAG